MRQIPYTMMKFACFERTVEFLYKYVVPKPRADCTKGEQLVVTFSAGYIAGVFCAVVSHPADTVVSKLNNDAGSTAVQAARELGMKGIMLYLLLLLLFTKINCHQNQQNKMNGRTQTFKIWNILISNLCQNHFYYHLVSLKLVLNSSS